MKFRPFQLARILGIPLMIDYSWLPMAVLHVFLVSQFFLPTEVKPQLPLWQNFTLGIVITALFFASVIGHELAHAIVARLEGIKIHDIQLHIFGGWARLVGEPRTAMAEFARPPTLTNTSFIVERGVYRYTGPEEVGVTITASQAVDAGAVIEVPCVSERGVTVWRSAGDRYFRLRRGVDYLLQLEPAVGTSPTAVIYLPVLAGGSSIVVAGPGGEPPQ